METIYKRRSVRKYLKEGLSNKQNELIEDKVRNVKHKGLFGNEILIQLIKPGIKQFKLSYGIIRGMAGYMYSYVNKSIESYMDYGYVMEKNLLEMTKLDIGTCWLGGTFNKKFFSSINEAEDRIITAVIAFGKYQKKEEKIKKRKPFEEMFFEDELGKPLAINEGDKLYFAFEALRLAPSAVNGQPWRVVKKDNVIRFYQKIKSQAPNMNNIDMGIGMAHFEYGLNINKIPYKWLKENIEGTKQYMYCISIQI